MRAADARPASSTSAWSSGSPRPAARLVTSETPSTSSTGLAGRDRLERRRHADEVATDGADHADLGGGLVVRSGELRVDALVEVRLDLAAQLAQPAAVEVGQVDERRALERGRGGQVDVVADEHRRPRLPGLVEAAAAVGQHHDAAAGCGGGADTVHDGSHAEPFVEVGAAQEHEQVAVTRAHRAHLARMTRHGWGCEAGQVRRTQLGGGLAERVGGGQPPGAQDDRDVVGLDAGPVAEHGGRLGGEVGGGVVGHVRVRSIGRVVRAGPST